MPAADRCPAAAHKMVAPLRAAAGHAPDEVVAVVEPGAAGLVGKAQVPSADPLAMVKVLYAEGAVGAEAGPDKTALEGDWAVSVLVVVGLVVDAAEAAAAAAVAAAEVVDVHVARRD